MVDIEKANKEVVEKMIESHPILIGIGKANEVIPNFPKNTLLHAGPPIEWEKASGPLRGAIIGALIWEKIAKDEKEAIAIMEKGEIKLAPCHHYNAVGPMAGIISPSMAVYIVENKTYKNKAYCNLNEGYGKVLRYGAYSKDVLDKLTWMNEILAPALKKAIEKSKGIDLRALISEALHMGDEGHNRNKAGSILFIKSLLPYLIEEVEDRKELKKIVDFMGNNYIAFLNPIMAACKSIADAGHGIEGSTIVTTMARNGTDFGIRVSGLGDEWFTAPSQVPKGLYFTGYKEEDANPDIGDSTITETAGIGGFAMASAPAIVTFVGGTPKDAYNTTLEMYEITYSEHKYFTIPYLNFRGTPIGIDIRKVLEKNIVPRVNTGIAHKKPGIGQIGAGLVKPPMEIFEKALLKFSEKYNIS